MNYKSLDRKNDFLAEDYSKGLLNSLPYGSFIVSQDWDYLISPADYLQDVNHFRKDIDIIILYWLEKDWYKKDLKRKYSSLKEFIKIDYYITFDILKELIYKNKFNPGDNSYIIPDVLTFKIVHDKNYHQAKNPDFKIRFREERNKNENYYYTLIAWILENRAEYELSFNKTERAKIYTNKILSDFPDYKISPNLVRLINK